jgi:hypothetical protein
VDDVSPQPKPRSTARAPKRVAPADPRIDDRPRKRTPGRATSSGSNGTTDAPVLPTSSVIADPLLMPVQDGTPVEIPVIVPAQLDDGDTGATVRPSTTSARDDLWSDSSLLATAAVPMAAVVMPEAPTDDYTSDLPRPPEFTDIDGTDGLPSLYKPERPPRALRPVKLPKGPRPRVRRVTRVIRQIDTWSVFKVALGFSLFLYLVCLTAGVLLWQVAQNTGTVDNVERFFESFGWQTFQLKGGAIFHNAWVGGLFLVVGLTGLSVLAATMFNLIAELVGGIRVTVLEEEVVAREARGTGWRRGSRHVEAPLPSADDATGSTTLG